VERLDSDTILATANPNCVFCSELVIGLVPLRHQRRDARFAALAPLIGKCHWRPGVATPLLVQAAQAGKQHMRPRDENILVCELRQQLIPGRRSRINVKGHGHLGVPQRDALGVDCVTPKQYSLSFR
jgi:hypothetical protein